MTDQQYIAEAKQKIKTALQELEEATGEVVEDINIERRYVRELSSSREECFKAVRITFKENPIEG